MVLDKNRLLNTRRNRSACVRDGSGSAQWGPHGDGADGKSDSTYSASAGGKSDSTYSAGAGGKSDCTYLATAAGCPVACRSRWAVLVWWEGPSGPRPSRCQLRSGTQPGAARSHAQRPHQQVPAGGCPGASTDHHPTPALSPFHNPIRSRGNSCFSSSSLLEASQAAGGGSWSRAAAPLRPASGSSQSLLLKHWFQMVLDTETEKSKPPCETSFQKKRVLTQGRRQVRAEGPASAWDVLLKLYLWWCYSHAFRETNSLRTMQTVGVQFITPAGPRQSPLSQGPRPAFVKMPYVYVSEPTTPNSLSLTKEG